MRHLRNQDDYWKPCRPGTIFQATDSKFRRQRRKFVVQMAMGCAVVTAGIFSGIFVLFQKNRVPVVADNESQPTESIGSIKLTCNDIGQLAPMYVNAIRSNVGKRTEEQALLIADFDQHLRVCQNCSAMIFKAVNEV